MNSYEPTNWLTGDIITSVGLNNIEHGIKLALTDINNLITETQQNSANISSIGIDISNIQDDIDILNTRTRTNTTNISSLRTDVDNIQSYTSTLNTKILNNKNNIDIIDENISILLTNISSLNTEIQGNKNNINLINTNINGIQNDIDSTETNITNIQSNINSIETDIDDIQTSLSTIETNTNTNIQGIQTNINNLNTQVNNNKTNITNIQNDIDSIETNITNALTNISNLDTKVRKNENDINSIETNIDTVLTNITNLNTRVQNTATDAQTAIKETKKITTLNIAGMVEGELTSQNIVTAINLALNKSSYLYIPSGEYSFNINIASDCTIYMDKLCFISSATADPVIHAQNCSINLIGGNILNGTNNDSRVAIANKRGLIFLENCYNSSIVGINSPYSKTNSVIWIKDCENFVLEQSTFSNMLRAAMFVCGHCVNVTVRNCKFTNSVPLDGQDYCYFVYTGSTSFTDNFEPIDGLIYENNYCSNSEDCGLDTHGARNVIIRNNVVLNTVCAITAYNDNKRMTRPEGWKMENILIENNYCDSTKQNTLGRKYPHPFLFIGASKDGTTENGEIDSENLAFFDEFRNCTVRNNTFRTANNYQYGAIFTDVVSRNLTFENNTFRFYEGATASIRFRRSFGSVFKNNRAEGGTAYVIFKQFSGEAGMNVGFRYSCDENTVNYVKGLDNNFPEIPSPTYKSGDTFWSEVPKICTSYGICAKFQYKELIKTFNITVTDGIATVARNLYIPHLALTLSNGTSNISAYIKDVIDIMHFLVVKGDKTPVADGTYTATIKDVTAVLTDISDLITETQHISDFQIINNIDEMNTVITDKAFVLHNNSPWGNGGPCWFEYLNYATEGGYARHDGGKMYPMLDQGPLIASTPPVDKIMAIISSYVERDDLVYGNDNTLFESETTNVIDCSAFVSAVLHGIPYSFSKYTGSTVNRRAEKISSFSPTPLSSSLNPPLQRLRTRYMAQYFAEQGWLHKMPSYRSIRDVLQFGDILFSWDGTEVAKNRFLKIGHVSIVLAVRDSTQIIVAQCGGYPSDPSDPTKVTKQSNSNTVGKISTIDLNDENINTYFSAFARIPYTALIDTSYIGNKIKPIFIPNTYIDEKRNGVESISGICATSYGYIKVNPNSVLTFTGATSYRDLELTPIVVEYDEHMQFLAKGRFTSTGKTLTANTKYIKLCYTHPSTEPKMPMLFEDLRQFEATITTS